MIKTPRISMSGFIATAFTTGRCVIVMAIFCSEDKNINYMFYQDLSYM